MKASFALSITSLLVAALAAPALDPSKSCDDVFSRVRINTTVASGSLQARQYSLVVTAPKDVEEPVKEKRQYSLVVTAPKDEEDPTT